MSVRTNAQTSESRTALLGRTLATGANRRKENPKPLTTHRDQPRASSPINDHYFVNKEGLLAGSKTLPQDLLLNSVNCGVVKVVRSAPGHSQKKEISPGAAACQISEKHKLKYVKRVSCVTHLSCAQPVINAQLAAQNLPVGARLQHFWQIWLDLGAGPKAIQILKDGYTLPFQTRPKLTRSPTVISCYVNPHRDSYLLEALHQLIAKNAVELVRNQKSLGFFNRLFLVPKPNNKWRPILDLSKLNVFLKVEKFKMETPETIRTSLHRGEWVTSIDFRDAYFHIPIQEQFQEVSQVSFPKPNIPVQGSALWSLNGTFGIHCDSQRSETNGHTQGYKDPPVPRRLVGESQIPPGLSPTYSDPSTNVQGSRLDGELGKVRTATQTNLRICRLPVRPHGRSSPTYTEPVAKPPGHHNQNSVFTGLSGQTVHVLDRSLNSHRKTSSPRQTVYETHTVAPQKQLACARISTKGDSNSQISASSLKMVASRRQRSHRPTITPHKTCSVNLYRRIKRRVGRSLKRTHCKRFVVPTGKQSTHKLPGIKSSAPSTDGIPGSMLRTHSTGSNQQHYSSVVHQQGGRNEVGPTLCSTMENVDLVHQTSGHSQSPTYTRQAERGSRQAISPRPDNSNRMVSPPRDFPGDMRQVAPARYRPVRHEVQQQVTSIRFTSTGHSGSGRTQSSMGGNGCLCFPPTAILGKVVEKLRDSHCKRIILIAPGWPNMPWFWDLVTMSSQIPLSLPNLLIQPFNQIPHRNLTNLNLRAWLLEPQQSRSRASLRQWQQGLRLKEDQPDQSMRQSGPFLQSGATLIRWTSGHPL